MPIPNRFRETRAQAIEVIAEDVLVQIRRHDHWFPELIRDYVKATRQLEKRFTRHRQKQVNTLLDEAKTELRERTNLVLDNELDTAIDFLIERIQYEDMMMEVFDGGGYSP